MTTDFLIVGGGIGGLVLAELLARGGKKVVVLERSTGPPPWNRPEVLWPATARLLCTLLPRDQWEAEAVLPLAGVRFFDGEQFRWAIAPEVLQRAKIEPWSTDPNRTRELLMRRATFELHRGVEVKEVLKERGRVVGVRARDVSAASERDWLAEMTIGDDGAHSVVRAACGIELRTHVFPVDLLCFECPWPAALPANAPHIWPNLKQARSGILALGMAPIVAHRGVGVIPVRPQTLDDLPRAASAWRTLIESEPNLTAVAGGWKFPDDLQRVRRPWGHAKHYGAAGAMVMGDAAHPVSPAGGQGANMSIADAQALGELILAGERDVLAAYEYRRRAANRRSLMFTRAAAFVFRLPERLVFNRLSASLLKFVRRREALIAAFMRTAATAFLDDGEH
jgi:2-polyprenyl-6-methoxyphenol hydroxylase-like FAD-dependent oxidoreductase